MRHFIILTIVMAGMLCFSSCRQKTQDDMAAEMIVDIEASVRRGDFRSALDSIVVLRSRYPKAVEARKKALALHEEASLQQAQYEAAKTDSLLKETLKQIETAPTLLLQNMLRDKRDSLQARYDAEMGVVKIIRARQNGKE